MVRCVIWYHLYDLKNVKNTHGGVVILVLKLTLLHGCFSCFLNCTNGTKSRIAPHIFYNKLVIRVAERTAKRIKAYDFRKLKNIPKISNLSVDMPSVCPASFPQIKLWAIVIKKYATVDIKVSHSFPILLNFFTLFQTFRLRLS